MLNVESERKAPDEKTIKFILITVITMLVILSFGFNNMKVEAVTPTIEELQEEFSKYGEELQGKDIDSITKDDILEIYDDVTSKYSNEEIADIISENKIENQRLKSLKEFILPLLMNGQINVDDIEI